MSLESVSQRIAARVYFDELATARAIGFGGVDAYVSAFRAMDAAYSAAFEPDREFVGMPLKMVTGGAR